jgi:flavorubredoxin
MEELVRMEKVIENIFNVGVNDKEVTLFEGQYKLEQGMAYNSYVILDEKVVIMDTVDKSVSEEWLRNVDEVLQGRDVDYLVVQHMEPDHSGTMKEILDKYPNMKIIATAPAINMMKMFLDNDVSSRTQAVKEGDTLELGSHTLKFIAAPMVHWPEVMITYEQSEKVIFSADAFGKFGTRDAEEDWTCEARRYYFNICGKYGVQVQNLLKKLAILDINVICPLHGPVLTENIDYYINKYDIWSKYEPEDKGIFIVYASIHGNTAQAAEKLKEIIELKSDVKVSIADVCREDIHECVEDAFRYDRVVFAASSYDAGVFPPMEDLLRRLQDKNYQNRTVAIIENGSWAPTAGKTMKAMFEKMKNITVVEPIVTIKAVMKEDTIVQLEKLADTLIEV